MKKTICFSQPAYLSSRQKQLVIEQPEGVSSGTNVVTVPLEDIAVLVLENPQITITHSALSALIAHNVAVITCSDKFLPNGLFLNLDGHTLQSKRFRAQLEASQPLKKQLWAQTVQCKIRNQAAIIARTGFDPAPLLRWCNEVRSGDLDNKEARAAAWYWPKLFNFQKDEVVDTEPDWDGFIRDRYGLWPNALLNYGYAVLRALVARALVASGLLPALGIHHRNQYNAYCLADDIMEPYRPFVDGLVHQLVKNHPELSTAFKGIETLTPALKRSLLSVPAIDVRINSQISPLQEAVKKTTASLFACFEGTERKITYPEIP